MPWRKGNGDRPVRAGSTAPRTAIDAAATIDRLTGPHRPRWRCGPVRRSMVAAASIAVRGAVDPARTGRSPLPLRHGIRTEGDRPQGDLAVLQLHRRGTAEDPGITGRRVRAGRQDPGGRGPD